MSTADLLAGASPPDITPIFAALGDQTRLSLMLALSDGQARSIHTLAADRDLSRQAVTKHLRVLERAGLVASVRVGRESRFAGRPERLTQARACLDQVSAYWDESLSRLKALVESDGGATP
mgnify:CR=1 FL=1|jgi:DNA-binding transcriptional ArsR family regulator